MKHFALAAFVALSLSAFSSPAFAEEPKSQNCAGATLGVSSLSLEATLDAISDAFKDVYANVSSIWQNTDSSCTAFETQLNEATVHYVFDQTPFAEFEDNWNGVGASGTAF